MKRPAGWPGVFLRADIPEEGTKEMEKGRSDEVTK
jgi:hypothetical protein